MFSIRDSGFGIQVQGFGCGVYRDRDGDGLLEAHRLVWGLAFRVMGFGFGVWGFGVWVLGVGFEVLGLGFGVWG